MFFCACPNLHDRIATYSRNLFSRGVLWPIVLCPPLSVCEGWPRLRDVLLDWLGLALPQLRFVNAGLPAAAYRPQVNMGRFQAPVYVASRSLHQFAEKAILWNSASYVLGYRGMDRAKTIDKPVAAAGSSAAASSSAGPAEEGKLTLRQAANQTWSESTANQLERAAMLYGVQEHYHLQRLVVRCLTPCSEFHTRHLVLSKRAGKICFSQL